MIVLPLSNSVIGNVGLNAMMLCEPLSILTLPLLETTNTLFTLPVAETLSPNTCILPSTSIRLLLLPTIVVSIAKPDTILPLP